MIHSSRQIARQRRGATMVEYALLLLFIALACFVAVGELGSTVIGLFDGVVSHPSLGGSQDGGTDDSGEDGGGTGQHSGQVGSE
jgi:Flp pilus assembly pilin Flp